MARAEGGEASAVATVSEEPAESEEMPLPEETAPSRESEQPPSGA